ncbi:MAG: tetraacyldisaccharide 4'-kinase [Hyphomicrobiales bacterium]
MRAPDFWWRENSLASKVLAPISHIYGFVAGRPFGKGLTSKIPVICIGNFTAGGAGKTPVARSLAKLFQARGDEVVFLSRGYGGVMSGPHLVSSTNDRAQDVGDEPLLLAKCAPTIIAQDRVAGLKFIEQRFTPDLIIMDDGFQSARIKPHHALLVVDGQRGLGNGKVMPAGPLRAPLPVQLEHADSLLVVQSSRGNHATVDGLMRHFEGEQALVFNTSLKLAQDYDLANKRVVAFSGIGNPQKFFNTVEDAGADLVSTVPFPDHHPFTEADAANILEQAALFDAEIVTTAKDAIRLEGSSGNLAKLLDASKVIEVEAVFDVPPNLNDLVRA